jgi:small-conductance mechanosensitive channel
MISILYIIVVVGLAHVLWQGLARHEFQAEGHTRERLGYINFGLGLSLSIFLLRLCLYTFDINTPQWLGRLLFVTWTATVLLILWQSTLPAMMRVFATVFVSSTILILFFFSGGLDGFLARIDDFARAGSGGGIRPSDFLKWLFYFVHAFTVLNFYGRMYEIRYRDRLDRGEIQESLHEDAIERSVAFLSFGLAFLVALGFVGTDVKALGLFSGLLAAGLSVALKDLLANLGAGMFLLLDRSVKLDDVISLGDNKYGMVKSMTMRYLVLEDRNEIRYLVPNSDFISRTVTNWTHKNNHVRLKIDVGVAYDSDIRKVQDIMESICLKVARIVTDPPPRALVIGAADSAVNVQLRFFIADPENGIKNVMSEVYSLLLESFRQEEISIPFPQREIRIVSDKPEDTKS